MSPRTGAADSRTLPGRVAAARAAWGLLLVSLARPASERVLGRPATRAEVGVVRVLGGRHLAQAAVVTAAPRTAVAGRAVDLVHLASMLLLAAVDRPRRRAALLSATVAGALAAASAVEGRPS
jgi:hypothetical protein